MGPLKNGNALKNGETPQNGETKIEVGIVGPGANAAADEPLPKKPTMQTETIPLTESASKKDSTPIHLVFKDLTVSVDNGNRKILQNVSGEVKPGEVLAIMGPSGAGKTTLLSILAGRANSTGCKIESGDVTINGGRITKRARRKVGFVLQEDTFFTHLTMRQTLQFAAELRLPETFTKQQKIAKVDDISEILSLQKCQNTIMGGGIFVRGISGGEKKRASIGVELITNPSLLLMDEPTSGLDSSTAFSLVKTLKKLAKSEGKAIIATIHQPSSQIFHMFDKLLLLCNGQVAYYGTTPGVIEFFNDIGRPCYPNWNAADYIMDMMKAGEDIEQSIVDDFKTRYPEISVPAANVKRFNGLEAITVNIKSPSDNNLNETDKQSYSLEEVDEEEDTGNESKWQASFSTQLSVLTRRTFIQTKANILDRLNFIQTFALALMVGLLWLQTPYDEKNIRDRTAVLFFSSVFWSIQPLMNSLVTFPVERTVIRKERAAGMYRLSSYYLSKCISELPLVILQPAIYWTIVYWMAGLNQSVYFLVSLCSLLLSSIASQSIGLFIGSTITDLKRALIVASLVFLGFMLLGGFYNQNIPEWLSWVKYVSVMKYSYDCLLQSEFIDSPNFRCLATNSNFDICQGQNSTMALITGKMILDDQNSLDLYLSMPLLFANLMFYRIVTYIALKYLGTMG